MRLGKARALARRLLLGVRVDGEIVRVASRVIAGQARPGQTCTTGQPRHGSASTARRFYASLGSRQGLTVCWSYMQGLAEVEWDEDDPDADPSSRFPFGT